MIYHVLPANTYHITPQVISSIMKKTANEHFFILIGNKEANIDWSIYKNMFEELCCKHFIFFDNDEHFFYENTLSNKSFVILHSDSYNWKVFFYRKKFRNIHWVCWGSGVDVKINVKSIISYVFRILLYRSLKSIITLSIEDKQKLKKKFFVKNLDNISYFESVNDLFSFNKENLKAEYKSEVSVFIGNNSSAISTYVQLLKSLKRFNKNIKITAMLNYDLVKNQTYKELLEVGSNIYGINFKTDEKLYDLKDFPSYINKCDIYVCSVEEQTGLGAIYAALKLGKKIFLNGNNFNFITSLGCKVFHVDELHAMDVKKFLAPMLLEEQYLNFDVIMSALSDDKLIEKWNTFYNKYS